MAPAFVATQASRPQRWAPPNARKAGSSPWVGPRSVPLEVGRSAQPLGQLRGCWRLAVPEVGPERRCRFSRSAATSGTFGGVELGYARVSTVKQDLDRQIDALEQVGIPRDRIYVDRKSGATTDRPGLREVIAYAREGDVIVVHTLDRLGRTVRDTLNFIHELSERKVGVRNLADPINVDSSNPEDPMAQLAVVLLALFGQMERTYTMERAAHARAVATAKGRRVGRPVLVDPGKLEWAAHLRDTGSTIPEIIEKTGIPRTSLYRHLPPRPEPAITADGGPALDRDAVP
jgi:DNA invertase Pin-like site-specific DNA recombinase